MVLSLLLARTVASSVSRRAAQRFAVTRLSARTTSSAIHALQPPCSGLLTGPWGWRLHHHDSCFKHDDPHHYQNGQAGHCDGSGNCHNKNPTNETASNHHRPSIVVHHQEREHQCQHRHDETHSCDHHHHDTTEEQGEGHQCKGGGSGHCQHHQDGEHKCQGNGQCQHHHHHHDEEHSCDHHRHHNAEVEAESHTCKGDGQCGHHGEPHSCSRSGHCHSHQHPAPSQEDLTLLWKQSVMPAIALYHHHNGHCDVPEDFVVPADNTWPEPCWGLRLGKVVEDIRFNGAFQEQIAQDRAEWSKAKEQEADKQSTK